MLLYISTAEKRKSKSFTFNTILLLTLFENRFTRLNTSVHQSDRILSTLYNLVEQD